ncbi:MAG: HNH endonuclease [Anaerolineaceae bacterium]|nr:HNH endonuclease [Anaerolineaceae bacterium]
MPKKSPTICRHPGCPDLAFDGVYCIKHKKERGNSYENKRGSSSKRGYGSRWRSIRNQILKQNPLCVLCLEADRVTAATEVDHIIPKARGGTDFPSNLQALCKECHSRKTSIEDGGFGRQSVPPSNEGEGGIKSLEPASNETARWLSPHDREMKGGG